MTDSCSVCGSASSEMIVTEAAIYCRDCAAKRGIALEPSPASRAAAVVSTQCWKYLPKRGIEAITLSKPHATIRDGGVELRRWYITPKGSRATRAVVYSAAAPPSEILDQVVLLAAHRFRSEPWMSNYSADASHA